MFVCIIRERSNSFIVVEYATNLLTEDTVVTPATAKTVAHVVRLEIFTMCSIRTLHFNTAAFIQSRVMNIVIHILLLPASSPCYLNSG